ncbi:MAG TPA: hypothetical protein VLZ75_05420 [Chitinophagales bacterium]|nr:hypothetical protein [Chitinophagales bacterium]
METNIKIKLIKRKKIWYDIGPYAFLYIPAILISLLVTYFVYNDYNFGIVNFLFISIYLLYIFLLDKKKYGWWIKNYEVIGEICLSNEVIEIQENGIITTYKINELRKIHLKEDFYQNYTAMRDIIHNGIGSIILDNGYDKRKVFFLLVNKSELESLHALKSEWKRNGLSIWT